MEFLVGFDVTIPDGTRESEVKDRASAEAIAAADWLARGILCASGRCHSRPERARWSACTGPKARQSSTVCSAPCR